MQNILELFNEYKLNERELADTRLENLTNESGLITPEIFSTCELHEFILTLTENMEIGKYEREEVVIDCSYKLYYWSDTEGNILRVTLHYEMDEAVGIHLYQGYSIEFIPSPVVTAKKNTFSKN